MINPWIDLKSSAPFVLECDRQIIDMHNGHPKIIDNHKIHTELYPEPFLGNPKAPVVLLNLNPGFSEGDIAFHKKNKYFIEQARRNLAHQAKYDFYLLDPKIDKAPGYNWWNKRLRTLIEACDRKTVARNIFCIELFPYHSANFKRIENLESQKYNAYLVKRAIERKALIILMRSKRLWIDLIPEIKSYSNYYELKNPRCAYITKRNLPKGAFELIVSKIMNY